MLRGNKMNIEPKIEIIKEKKLVGNRHSISVARYEVGPLWKVFSPRRKEIENTVSNDLISMSIYNAEYFLKFDPTTFFEKWATAEVTNFDKVPNGMETFILPSGLYAIFSYKGSSTDLRIFDYIFKTWLPQSEYQLDDRPHFEILGAKYRNNDPNSEEEIFIPVKKR
jgi:AraC family transcriptional regulator